ncbi:MAG: 30S ribosomal protein S16, partial [Planctomycetes bacterium]|nr:30S ribosomal protein S16 [Planctomycetota bacterium]
HIGGYNSRTRRDGRPVEELGFYDPKSDKEPVRIDIERARYWLSVGARPSATVATILKGQGVASSEWAKKAASASDKDKKVSARKASAKKKSANKAKAPAGTAAKKRKPRTASSKARGERTAKA